MNASAQIVAEGWKPALSAPFSIVLNTRFLRDGKVIEREMVRLRERLWWDVPFSQYAHEEPFEYSEYEGHLQWHRS